MRTKPPVVAIPASTNVRGLRLRVGNIQVGGDKLLEDLFPEPRFNSWSVGEIHILDQRVTPNGRRDHCEQNVHYLNILNHLGPSFEILTKDVESVPSSGTGCVDSSSRSLTKEMAPRSAM